MGRFVAKAKCFHNSNRLDFKSNVTIETGRGSSLIFIYPGAGIIYNIAYNTNSGYINISGTYITAIVSKAKRIIYTRNHTANVCYIHH